MKDGKNAVLFIIANHKNLLKNPFFYDYFEG